MGLLSTLAGLARGVMLAALSLAFAAPVWAQCAMCREAAGGQKAAAILALNKGIILLGVPPVAIILGIAWLTYKHRRPHGDQGA
jgi:hypothetical protein